MNTTLLRLLAALLTLDHVHSATLTLTAPLDYQVVQREDRNKGTIVIQGRLSGARTENVTLEARMITKGEAGEQRQLPATFTGERFSTMLESPAGGWHCLELRALGGGRVLAEAAVEHVGVGELFVVAGQSNAANHGQERQSATSGRVVTFDGERWGICNDPQPGASGTAGSFLPPFGDAIAQRFGVPVGFVACGIGATSVREWLPKGARFPNPPTLTGRVQQHSDGGWESNGEAFDMLVARLRQWGNRGFRAVLWHQGESDANQPDPTRTLPGSLYREYLEQIIRKSRAALGWEAPWFVAQVSYHVPGDEASPDIRAAQASLWKDGIALQGPDSDALRGNLRENDGKGVHFSGPGLRAHAEVWVEKVAPWLERTSGAMPQAAMQGSGALTNLLPSRSSEAPWAEMTINTDAPSVPYSPLLFGGFIEHFDGQIYGGIFEPNSALSDARGFRKDVIAALKELKLSIVRWPGGCFASGYQWRDGIGPNRRPVPDPVWGVTDPNTFGTDEFVEWCRLVGCEPYICSNAGNGTPEQMRDWVQYCNAEGDRSAFVSGPRQKAETGRVRYWSIGNENWGGHEIGAKTSEEWGPLVLRSAELMRAVDTKLTLLAAATPERSWTLPLLKAAGQHLDYVAIHEYWLPCWGENLTPDYVTCILHSGGPERTVARVIELLEETKYRGRIKIAFDEWNLRGWHHPGFPRKQATAPGDPVAAELIRAREKNALPSQYTMADALFSASFLNACLRHAEDVGMANIAPIVNTRGPLFVHPKGLVKRTTFHTLSLYANELESRVAKTDVDAGLLVKGSESVPVVDGVATVDPEAKTWALALVNRHPSNEAACAVRMKNAPLDGTFPAVVLEGDSPEAYNDIERPDRVVPKRTHLTFKNGVVRLAPHSLSIVRVSGEPGS